MNTMQTTGENLIEIRDLGKTYRRGKQAIPVLQGVNLDVAAGDFFALMGPSGSGKTTLLNLIGGLDTPSAGSIVIGGQRVDRLGGAALARWRAAHVGFVFQFYNLLPMLSAQKNVELPLLLTKLSASERRKRAAIALQLVGLADRASHKPSELSGGQQQRVGVIRALAADAPLLLMDEPFGAVDPINRESIQNEFFEMQRKLGMTVIMVSHDIDEAIKLGDKVAVFKSGRLLQYDHPDTLLAHPADEFVSAFTGQDSTLKRLLLVRAEDAADSSLVTARPQTPVAEALELMDENDRRYLIVVDDQGKGLGYVRRKDLRRQEGTCAPFVTPFRVTASHDEHLRILLSRMYEFNSSWLPVLDPDQQFLGEVTQESIADYLSSGRSRGGKGLIVSPAEQVGA